MKKKKDPAAVKLGRRGGLATAARLTAAERSASAKHAVTMREKKRAEARKAGHS